MLDAEKLRCHILEDTDVLHDLILRYAAVDTSVKLARDWLEAQVWRGIEVLRQMEAERKPDWAFHTFSKQVCATTKCAAL